MGTDVEAREIEARLLSAYGIRVEPEMSRYVARQLQKAGRALRELAVIGGEAKTGAPRRVVVDPAMLQPAQPAQPTQPTPLAAPAPPPTAP